MKKNACITFCLACIPGAGEMYIGYMRRGLSLMTLFFGLIGILVLLQMEIFMVILPVIFAFCFFDTWNLRNQNPEQAQPDDFIIKIGAINAGVWKKAIAKRHAYIGWGCIACAALLLYAGYVMPIARYFFGDVFVDAIRSVPQLVIIALLVLLGVHLLRGPRSASQSSTTEEYVAYTGSTGADGNDGEK